MGVSVDFRPVLPRSPFAEFINFAQYSVRVVPRGGAVAAVELPGASTQCEAAPEAYPSTSDLAYWRVSMSAADLSRRMAWMRGKRMARPES